MEIIEDGFKKTILIIDNKYVGNTYSLYLKDFRYHLYKDEYEEKDLTKVFKRFVEDEILHHRLETKKDVDELNFLIKKRGSKNLEDIMDKLYTKYTIEWNYIPDNYYE